MQEVNKTSLDSTLKLTVSLFFLTVSILSGSFIFYDFIALSMDLYTMLAKLVFIVSSILAVVMPSYIKINFINRYVSNLVVWLVVLTCALSVVYLYNTVRNSSPVIYSVNLFSEEGVHISFRENNTFRSCNTDLFTTSISYGKYEKNDNTIVLLDEVKFGDSKMNDTLIINEKGIDFTLEYPWRISNGTLYYER